MQEMRKRARAWTGLLAVAMCLGVVAAGCGSSDSSDDASGGGRAGARAPLLRVGLTMGMANFDPTRDATGPQTSMRAFLYDSLIRLKLDGSPAPGLATSWRYVGSGNRAFELTLRRGVRFSDGTPLDAEAVKVSLDTFLKRNPVAINFGAVDAVKVVDPSTVRIELASGNPIMPWLLSDQSPAGAVASPKALASPKLLTKQSAGAGPYKIDPSDTVINDHYTLVPNPAYYDQSAIKYEKVTFKVITNAASMLQAMVSGQLDLADGDASTAAAAERAGLSVVSAPTQGTGLHFVDRTGTLSPPLADVRVRQAMNYAIDRDAIANAIVGKYGEPSSELLSGDGFDEAYQDHYPYDPQKARDLLQEAGYGDGFRLQIISQGFIGRVGEPATQAAAKYLRAVGIDAEVLTPATVAEYSRLAFSRRFPMLQASIESYPLWIVYSSLIAPTSVVNMFHARDADLDRLYAEGARAEDPSETWKEMSRVLTEKAILVPLLNAHLVWYVSEDVGGVSLSRSAIRPNPFAWHPE